MKVIIVFIFLLFGSSQVTSAQKVNFFNKGTEVVYAKIVNEIHFDLEGKDIHSSYIIEPSHGTLTRSLNSYYYYTFEARKVTFKVIDIFNDIVVDSIIINVLEIDDYRVKSYPAIDHGWSILSFRLDSISVQSKTLENLGYPYYSVSKFTIDHIRGKDTLNQYHIIGSKVDKAISDKLHNNMDCKDVLIFHSIELSLANYKMNINKDALLRIFCN